MAHVTVEATPRADASWAAAGRRARLLRLMTAGLVDSLVLSMAWTVVMLRITTRYGLVGAGLCSTSMLLGVALSAPFAGWLSRRTTGRGLLRTAAGVEAVLRLSVFVLLYAAAPLWLLLPCVTVMNVVAWTGYAGMRAEVAAVSDGAVGLTGYATVVAAVEAAGVALVALLPLGSAELGVGTWATMAAVYVLALLPTVVVAGGSLVPRVTSRPSSHRNRPVLRLPSPSVAVMVGSALMFLGSAPPLLSVALSLELDGRAAVAVAAIAFTVGSLMSPLVAAALDRSRRNGPVTWALLAAGIVAGWSLAPVSLAWLCVAQLSAGLCMTSLEGLIDTFAVRRRPDAVTATLAGTTAGRALGSAAGSAVFPAVVLGVGLSATTAIIAVVLVAVAVALRLLRFASSPVVALPDGGAAAS